MSAPIDLSALQAAINTRLTTLDYFGGDKIVIINEDEKDIDARINTALGQIGLMVLIGTPKIQNQETEAPESKPFNGKFTIEFAIGENPPINRTGEPTEYITCLNAMMAVLQRLHGWAPSGWKKLAVSETNPQRDTKRQVNALVATTERVLPPI